eukprot:615841_1
MSTLYTLLWTSLVNINAQSEEIFYSYNCAQLLDWIEDTGSYDPAVHTYTPISWLSGSPNCPRADAGGSSTAAKNCLRTTHDASISRIISTTGFQSIHLRIDVAAKDVEISTNDWCVIQYRTASTNWINVNIIQGDDYALNYDVFIQNIIYNNQQSFEVKMGIAANSGGDNCFFDNLKVFGIPYTETTTNQPTKKPSIPPTKKPSIPPTKKPSIPPTTPTKKPTSQPTHKPTNKPTTKPINTATDKKSHQFHLPKSQPLNRHTNQPINPQRNQSIQQQIIRLINLQIYLHKHQQFHRHRNRRMFPQK